MMTQERSGLEVYLGALDSIPAGEGRAFRLPDRVVAVFRLRDGALFAVDNACPHQGGPLAEGVAGGCSVVCPLHSHRFDLQTGACLNAPELRVRTYPVRESDGCLYLACDPAGAG